MVSYFELQHVGVSAGDTVLIQVIERSRGVCRHDFLSNALR